MPNSNYTSCYPFVQTFYPHNIAAKKYKNLTQEPAKVRPGTNRVSTVTKCLTEGCTGYYIDTISSSYVFICKDPKHKELETKGAAA